MPRVRVLKRMRSLRAGLFIVNVVHEMKTPQKGREEEDRTYQSSCFTGLGDGSVYQQVPKDRGETSMNRG